MNFENLNLISPLLQALKSKNYLTPTPIQEKMIPAILERHDIFGSAQTGSGKTAAFALPILQHLHLNKPDHRGVRALVLAPTRELAQQISENFSAYGRNLHIRNTMVFGGVSQVNQVTAIRKGVDIIVATPGRLLDLMEQKVIRLDKIEFLVLDEADRMLDMGFITDIKRIIAQIPKERQTIFCSATAPSDIKLLAKSILRNPLHVDVQSTEKPADIRHELFYVDRNNKVKLLQHLITEQAMPYVLVFTRTKRSSDKLARDLNKSGINSDAIHGNKSQSQRQRALKNFSLKKTRVLVATDVASRGIDIKQLPHVVNFDMPETTETYTHRIGRTGRAGASGVAVSFATSEDRDMIKPLFKLFPHLEVKEHPFTKVMKEEVAVSAPKQNGASHSAPKKPYDWKSKSRWRR